MASMDSVKVEDLAYWRVLPFFDRALDRVTVKVTRRLRVTDVEFPRLTKTEDFNIRHTARSGVGSVFTTSSSLALIITAYQSVQSEEVIVLRIEGKLVLDIHGSSIANYIKLNETSHDPPKNKKNMTGDETLNQF